MKLITYVLGFCVILAAAFWGLIEYMLFNPESFIRVKFFSRMNDGNLMDGELFFAVACIICLALLIIMGFVQKKAEPTVAERAADPRINK